MFTNVLTKVEKPASPIVTAKAFISVPAKNMPDFMAYVKTLDATHWDGDFFMHFGDRSIGWVTYTARSAEFFDIKRTDRPRIRFHEFCDSMVSEKDA